MNLSERDSENPFKPSGLGASETVLVLPKPLLFVLCLLPWLWTWLGLNVLEDYRLTVLLYELLGCFGPFWALRLTRPSFKRPSLLAFFVTIALIVLTLASMLWVAMLSGMNLVDPMTFVTQMRRIHLNPQTDFWLFAAYFLLFNPLVEELFWRGLILDGFRQHYTDGQALLISSFFFGAWHYVVISQVFAPSFSLLATGMVMLGGVIFGALYLRTGSLWPSILVHGLGADLALVILAGYLYVALGLMKPFW